MARDTLYAGGGDDLTLFPEKASLIDPSIAAFLDGSTSFGRRPRQGESEAGSGVPGETVQRGWVRECRTRMGGSCEGMGSGMHVGVSFLKKDSYFLCFLERLSQGRFFSGEVTVYFQMFLYPCPLPFNGPSSRNMVGYGIGYVHGMCSSLLPQQLE